MDWPRLRRDPMKPEKGAAKHTRAVIKEIVEGGAFTIRVAQLNKSWGRRAGTWVAWVEECGEDMYGFCSTATADEGSQTAMRRLSADLHRVLHVCKKHPHKIKTAYREPGWAWAADTKEDI